MNEVLENHIGSYVQRYPLNKPLHYLMDIIKWSPTLSNAYRGSKVIVDDEGVEGFYLYISIKGRTWAFHVQDNRHPFQGYRPSMSIKEIELFIKKLQRLVEAGKEFRNDTDMDWYTEYRRTTKNALREYSDIQL